MPSKTKLLISTCVPLALLAYYCWLIEKKRSRRIARPKGVEIGDILALLDPQSHRQVTSKEVSPLREERISWTVHNTLRLRKKMNDHQQEFDMEDQKKRLELDDAEQEVEIDRHESEVENEHENGNGEVNENEGNERHERDSATHSPSRDLATPNDHCVAGFSDNSSEVSSDSGKGGSEIANLNSLNSESSEIAVQQPMTLFEFELAQPLVGLLIGKFGCNVHEIRDKCGALVVVRKHPCNYRMKLITVEGTSQQIDEALVMIRRRFPLKRFPEVTLSRVDYLSSCLSLGMPTSVIVPATFQLHLPASVMFDAYVSAVVSGGQLFLQQPTHPTYSSLKLMDQCMNECYADSNCPGLPRPLDYGMVCAAPAQGGWYRAQVVSAENEVEQVTVKFLDYGGYAELPANCLRQIRLDFMSLPFQAAECYLANIIPVDSEENADEWKQESAVCLENLCSGVVLQAEAMGFTVEGVSVVNLYRVMEDGSLLSINKELVNRGYARWMETPEETGFAMAAVDLPQLEEVAPVDEPPIYNINKKKQKNKGKKKNRRNDMDDTAKLVKDLSLEA